MKRNLINLISILRPKVMQMSLKLINSQRQTMMHLKLRWIVQNHVEVVVPVAAVGEEGDHQE